MPGHLQNARLHWCGLQISKGWNGRLRE
jgi:hypothetical protein